ncbi:MAG: hypothetical protein H6502_04510 [Candidatus Woesearchaeota archaeon]|nr:MAG: hypothetical protein H6502_04510 [Candidatus Woesearchaeota archaeon]
MAIYEDKHILIEVDTLEYFASYLTDVGARLSEAYLRGPREVEFRSKRARSATNGIDGPSLVTRASEESNSLLQSALPDLFTQTEQIVFVSEENPLFIHKAPGPRVFTAMLAQSPYYWLVDPLDGDKQFLQANQQSHERATRLEERVNPEYRQPPCAIMATLMHASEKGSYGRPVLTGIYSFTHKTTFIGFDFPDAERGAYRLNREAGKTFLPISTSNNNPAKIITLNSEEGVARTQRYILTGETETPAVSLSVKSVGQKMLSVALGESDGYIPFIHAPELERTMGPWDIAPMVIVRAAGGSVLDLHTRKPVTAFDENLFRARFRLALTNGKLDTIEAMAIRHCEAILWK